VLLDTNSEGYYSFDTRPKCLFFPLNPALAYPFTYPFFQSSDIFYQQFKRVIACENIFAKLKNIFKKFRSKTLSLRPVAGWVFFCAQQPVAKHPSDVAVAWWSRPDEPASRNRPQSKGIY